ncbi:TetR/AcrR family transcriptional regulator [Kordiimonas sediminis]|nr:TetR/AcrR family transcriptional regulator [Kordiimonas sediminis]
MPEGTERQGRGRPRDREKNSAIIETASELFLENGFAGTSMDAVAKHAGVSKQTVYSHFSSKEQLFSESVRRRIGEHFPDETEDDDADHSLEADTVEICNQFAQLLVSDDAMSVYRVLVAEAPKGSELAKIFWEAGPRLMVEKLVHFLARWVEAGELEIDDLEAAAKHLLALLKGELHFQLAIGLVDTVDEAAVRAHAEECAIGFLMVYRKQPA